MRIRARSTLQQASQHYSRLLGGVAQPVPAVRGQVVAEAGNTRWLSTRKSLKSTKFLPNRRERPRPSRAPRVLRGRQNRFTTSRTHLRRNSRKLNSWSCPNGCRSLPWMTSRQAQASLQRIRAFNKPRLCSWLTRRQLVCLCLPAAAASTAAATMLPFKQRYQSWKISVISTTSTTWRLMMIMFRVESPIQRHRLRRSETVISKPCKRCACVWSVKHLPIPHYRGFHTTILTATSQVFGIFNHALSGHCP